MATAPALPARNIDLSRIERPNLQLGEALEKVELPSFDLPDVDLEGAVSQAAEAVGLRRPARRSRWWLALGGLLVATAAAWGFLRSPQARVKLQQVVRTIRERISSMRPNAFDLDVDDPTDPIAFPAAETKPIPPDRWNDTDDLAAPDYPEGLGADASDHDPAPTREENKSRT
jgi:hypothetical protein